jgi:hypothetical protein
MATRTYNRLQLTSGQTYTQPAGDTIIVDNYTAGDFDGADIKSDNPGNPFYFNVPEGVVVTNCTFTDCDASGGAKIDATDPSNTDGGRNSNIDFISDVTFNHTAISASATPGTHTTSRIAPHTIVTVSATTKSHTTARVQPHTTTSASATTKTHSTARIQPHSKVSGAATTKSHQPIVTFFHSKVSAAGTSQTHTTDRIQPHTKAAASATTQTHSIGTGLLQYDTNIPIRIGISI